MTAQSLGGREKHRGYSMLKIHYCIHYLGFSQSKNHMVFMGLLYYCWHTQPKPRAEVKGGGGKKAEHGLAIGVWVWSQKAV